MIMRIPYYLFAAIFFCHHQASGFQVVNPNAVSSPRPASPSTRSTSSLNYASVSGAQSLEKTDTESIRNSLLNTPLREESQVSVAQLLTDQVAREFTTGRRYLLAASAVKELADDFFDVEEQQRVRAMELLEFARTHDIELLDYASKVDKTPIDKSMETTDLLQELVVQEQKDVKLLEQAMAQIGSKNVQLFAFLETIRADQMERKDQVMQTLSDAVPSLQQTAVDTAASVSATEVSNGDFSLKIEDFTNKLQSKLENADQIPASVSRWADNQLQGLGQHIHDLISKSADLTVPAATVATVAAVDAVDPESLPSPEHILQVVDTASALLDQSSLMDAQLLTQIVDVVSGLY